MAKSKTPKPEYQNPVSDATSLPELVDEKTVSKRFHFSLNTLRYWRSIGDGPPFVKFGRAVRYNVAQLLDYIRRHTCEPKTRATAEEIAQYVAD